MYFRGAAIIVGLVVAGAPALAEQSDARKPTARPAVHRIAAKKPEAGIYMTAMSPAAAPIAEQAANAHRRAGARASHRRTKEKEVGSGILASQERASPAPENFSADVGWRLIEDPVTGARFGLPEKFVPLAGTSRTGSRWTSAQGQIQIETFRLTEAALPALFEAEKKASRRQVVSSQLKADSFIIIGTQGLKDFLVRADARGSEVRGVTILYDQATEGRMERLGLAMVSAFAGFPDPNAAPVPGLLRRVEYGTAIVVSRNGDLIAPAHVTDGCQSITVPGLGHAERIADDKTNDLALIRLYGARNLVPAILAGESSPGGDITLVGVADPLAQAGGAAVTSAKVRLTSQGIEPAPKLGFAGAAAVDTSGALTGMADFKAQVVAGSGPAAQTAALVPVEAIRAFLQASGVTPSGSGDLAPTEQSVVRVVCVRK
jgi:hypothetical protein